MTLQPTSGEYKKMFSSAYRSDILPRLTSIDNIRSGQNSLFKLDVVMTLPTNLPDSSKLYKNEKQSNVNRIGLPVKTIIDGKEVEGFESFYFKPYTSPFKLYDKMISSALLGMHAVPHEPYGVIYGGEYGVATIDLTRLCDSNTKQPVKSLRFDILLNKLGHAPDTLTFMDIQNLFYDSNLSKIMDRRAFVQSALGNFFLANAYGETDANSRNLILLENPNAEPMDETLAKEIFGETSTPPKKFGFAVRIDADENTHDTSKNNERSGKRIVGRCILFPNESLTSPMRISLDDKHILMQYCQSPEFVLEGAFIPPAGMTEQEYMSQIENDEERLKKARKMFEKQILEENSALASDLTHLDIEIEERMNKYGCYAMKKSFTQLIKEKNPNIDWGLFSELFQIANTCANETIARFTTDSMYYKQNSIFGNHTFSSKYQLSQDCYDDFALSTYQRFRNFMSVIESSLSGVRMMARSLDSMELSPTSGVKFEPLLVDRRGVPLIEQQNQTTQKTL